MCVWAGVPISIIITLWTNVKKSSYFPFCSHLRVLLKSCRPAEQILFTSSVCSFERSGSAEEVSHQCQRQQWASGWSINLRQQPGGLRSDWRLDSCLTAAEISFQSILSNQIQREILHKHRGQCVVGAFKKTQSNNFGSFLSF